jgi:hypothetical protein
MSSPRVFLRAIGLLGLAALGSGAPAGARQSKGPLVLFPVAFYGRGANSLEPGDSLVAVMTDSILREDLEQSGRFQLIDRTRLTQAMTEAEKGGKECVTLECRRELSRKLGATWMVTTKLSKTSNLIWLFTGQLIHAPTGTIILDDSTELKGPPEGMVRAGSRIFAERVARTVLVVPRLHITELDVRVRVPGATTTELTARPRDVAHGGMKDLREQKAHADLFQTGRHLLRREIDAHAERFQYVGAADRTRHRPIAVLGNGQPRSRGDEGGGGRDVERVAHVAAGAAGIDDVALCRHARGIAPHRARRAGDLLDPLALHPERDQQGADLCRRRISAHDLAHHRFHVGFAQVAARRERGNRGLDVHLKGSQPVPVPE